MKEKELYTLTIDAYGMEGEGVAHEDGFVFFVPYAAIGERVKVAVDRVKGKLVFAHIIKMLEPSPERRDPDCPLFGKCGGCALRHLPYDTQREIKTNNVRALFRKNVGLDLGESPFFGDGTDGYRNKIALPFGFADGEATLGMYRRGTHKVLPLVRCPLHGEWIEPLIAAVLSFVRERKISVYDEGSGKGLLRHLVARRLPTPNGCEYGVILVVSGAKIAGESDLADALEKALVGKVNLYLCENKLHNNVILTDKIRTIRGADHLTASIGGGTVEVSPLAFLQVNFGVAEKIYARVAESIPEGTTVVDAYSGTGIMSALLAKKAERVIGIETIPDAVRDANANAARFGVADKVEHICGEVEKVLPDLAPDLGDYTLVVDPPRAGLDPKVVDTILSYPPARILYVSCSPATLTRDLARLQERYAIDSVELFDMFPSTPHVETVSSLTKKC